MRIYIFKNRVGIRIQLMYMRIETQHMGLIMTDSIDEKNRALSSFFRPIGIMAPKLTKKSEIKPVKTKAVPKKETPKKTTKKPKRVETSEESSDESDSSDESSSEDEPPRRKAKETKGKAKKIESSESDSDDGITVETVIPKKSALPVYPEAFDKIASGLVSIAEQLVISNQANAKILAVMATLLERMEIREQKDEIVEDVFESANNFVRSSGSIIIGKGDDVVKFDDMDDFKKNAGNMASSSIFTKTSETETTYFAEE